MRAFLVTLTVLAALAGPTAGLAKPKPHGIRVAHQMRYPPGPCHARCQAARRHHPTHNTISWHGGHLK
jgi:hypothetical protein